MPELSKVCTKCNVEKTYSEFNYRKETIDNLTSWCRCCLSKKNKNWSIKNKEYLRDKRKKERIANPEKYKEKFKKWYLENAESQKERARKYRKNNPYKVKETNKKSTSKRLKNDVNYKILVTLRNRMCNVIRRSNGKKAYKTIDLVGCSIEYLKSHLQSKFKKGMTFENHGKWHIDHIIPCASFDLTKPEEQKKCFHYTNLQPLWAKENILKRDKII